jgi:hypothetical protein
MGAQYRSFYHTKGLNMQIKRLLDDRQIFVGDNVFDAQGRSYAFSEHFGGEPVFAADGGRPIGFKPSELGCYVIHGNRTNRGLAKEQLRDYWAG